MRASIYYTVYIGHDVFFRSKILILNHEQISDFIDQLEKETLELRKECMSLSWSMRGGAQYDAVMAMSHAERDIIHDISKENIKIAKKSGLPFF